MEGLKEAIQYLIETGGRNEKPEVLEICGKTYCTKDLHLYGRPPMAEPIKANSLTALVDYISSCSQELPGAMIIHVQSPTMVRLVSALNIDRKREELFRCEANVSSFVFDRKYSQEDFIINLQANFIENEDLRLIQSVAGNVEAKTTANYGDNGITQKATVSRGIASKEDIIVPNPCVLVPYRTFQEVEQPASTFVFRIHDEGTPYFKLIGADNDMWMCEAIRNIKDYLQDALNDMPSMVADNITIIG